MHDIRSSNGHPVGKTPTNKQSFPLHRTQQSRCTKPASKGHSSTRHGDNHIEINSAALEAFLRQYGTDIDETQPLHTNLDISQSSEPPVLNDETEDNEIEDDWDNSVSDYAPDRSTQRSRSSSPALAAGKAPVFDLISLIPPSALAPYLPQHDLGLELIDLYFLELPSAKLMFDQQTVVRRYKDSTLPTQILCSIFAIAALYRAASASPANQSQTETAIKRTHDKGHVWAELASQMALTKSDIASLTTVRACEQISLYWFAVGERDRANVHADIAYQLYRTMARSFPDRRQVMNFCRAIWLHDSFSEYQKPYQDTTRLQSIYPRYESFMKERGLVPTEVDFDPDTQHTWNDRITLEDYSSSIYAVGALGLWREVNAFLRESIRNPVRVDYGLAALEHRLRAFHDALPNAVRPRNLMDFQLAGPAQDAMLSFTLVHCANMICLHSSRVPSLLNMKELKTTDSKTSESVIIEMARAAGEMIHEYITSYPRGRKVVPITGYWVFAIGAVHAHMDSFRDGPGWSEAWIYGASCLLLLEHIKSYWPVLDKLCKNLRRRFSYSDPNMMTISTNVLWQLAAQPYFKKNSTDQLTTGFFSIPYSTSFVHEMLGLDLSSDTTPRGNNVNSPINSKYDSLHFYDDRTVLAGARS